MKRIRRSKPTEAEMLIRPEQANVLNDMSKLIWANAKDKGFKDKKVPLGELCSNLHGEVSELWEAYRAHNLKKPCDKADKMLAIGIEPLTCAEEEIADIIIRALDTAAELKINIGRAVAFKHAFNRSRPRKHGNKAA